MNITKISKISEFLKACNLKDEWEYYRNLAKDFGFVILRTDELWNLMPKVFENFILDFYQIYYSNQQSMKCFVLDKIFDDLETRKIIGFCGPSLLQSYEMHGDTIPESYELYFDEKFLKDFPFLASTNRFFFDPKLSSIEISQDLEVSFLEKFRSLYKLYKNFRSKQVIQAELFALIRYFETVSEEQNSDSVFSNSPNSTVESFLLLARQEVYNKRTVKYFSDTLGISNKFLNSLLSKNTGKTIKQWISEIAMEEAKSLLVQTKYPILKIAYLLNFDEATNFNKKFKKLTGVTPGDFRIQKVE